jgi:hypothetical protein
LTQSPIEIISCESVLAVTHDEKQNESLNVSMKEEPFKLPNVGEIISLYAFKGDLKKGFRANPNIRLWRLLGKDSLQMFTIDEEVIDDSCFFKSTIVRSAWQEHRKEYFLEIKAECVSKTKETFVTVELLDIKGIEKICIDENFAELDVKSSDSFISDMSISTLNSSAMMSEQNSTIYFAEDTLEAFDEEMKVDDSTIEAEDEV